MSAFSGVACAQGQPSSIAVIRGEDNDAADDAFVSQWEVGLSRAPGIQLLERSFIQDVLDEHHLRAAGFTAHIPNAAQWGRLLSADILLFARRVPHEEMPIYNIRVVEGGTGIVLLSFLTRNEVRSEDVARVTDAATLAVARKHIDETKRHYLGILQIKSEEVGTALDGASQSLSVFLAEDLARSPHVVILDREHLQYLQQEQALTGLDLKLKSSAVVVEGGLKYGPQQKTIDVTLILRSLGGEDVVSFQIPAADMNFEKARRVLAQKILDHLSVNPPRFPTRDPRKETGLYMRQVPLLLASGKYDEAVRCAEVALALSPAQETRYWAARAWYALGRSLRTSSSLAAMNMIQTAPAQATRLPQRSDDGMALRIAKPREKNGRSVERSHGTYRVDGGQLERMLSAFLRAYTLVEEITRIHISNSEGGVIPDPLKGFAPDESRERLRMNSPLQAILKGQDSRNQRLLRQVIDVSRSSVDQQRKFYAAHYTRSGDIQSAYWTTWENEKALNADHYGYDPQRMTQMVGGAFEVFNRLPPGHLEIRLKGLAGVMALGPAMELSPEEKALYESLLASEDPWIQLLANKQLIRDDALRFSLNMMAIFAGKIAGNPAVWTMNDEKFIPDLLRSAIHRLAVSDREALLTHGQSVYQIILKKENVRHLLAWQSRDVFWPYVNSLVLNHREKEARRVMEQAIAVLKDNPFPDGEDARGAGALRLQLDRGLLRLGMKGAADHGVMTGAEDIGKPPSFRLRPELEPPGPDVLLDLPAFPPAPESSRGLQTATIRRSAQRVNAAEGGDVFRAGWTRTIDAEGNEQYTVYNVDAAAEKEKEKIHSSPAWDRYIIERMSTRVTAITPPEQRYRTGQKAAVTRNHLIDGKKIYIVKEGRQEDNLKVTVFEHDLRDAHDNRQLGTAVVPVADQRTFYVTALTSDDNHLYVGTAGGLLVFKKGGGDVVEKVATMPVSAEYEPSYLGFSNQVPETRTKGVRHLHEKNGFPDNRILSLAHFDGRIYIGIGSAHEGLAGDCGFAAYDPHTGTYDLLASNRSLKKRHPLDGGDVYQIDAILVDASRQALWLAVHGNSKLNGLWRFDIKERQFYHQVKEDMAIQDMQWVGDTILYVMYGSGLTLYDPQTEKKTWLLGYAVSVYSGPSAPVPPKDVRGGAPLYGYPETRLWPVAMQGEDLFTLGWTGQEVLLNQRGGKVFEKSMLNPDAGVVTGKRYLAGDEHGIWVITDYGEVYRIRPRTNPGGKKGR